MTTFSPPYPPSYGSVALSNYRVIVNEFGDGYAQTVPDGLNNVQQSWELSWANIPNAAAADIVAQINSFAGRPFSWTTPDGLTKNFTCASLSRSFSGFSASTVTATFVESFSA